MLVYNVPGTAATALCFELILCWVATVGRTMATSHALSPHPTCSYTEQPPADPYTSHVTRQITNGALVQVDDVPFTWNQYTYTSHLAHVPGQVRPLILIWPNYAGEKQFDIDQAVFLAKCGYTAISIDMYKETPYENGVSYPKSNRNPRPSDGRDKVVDHFKGAFTAYNWFQLHPRQWRDFQTKMLAVARQHPSAHPTFAAAIGYCFGGQCCLEQVRAGDDIQGMVSFHGVLQSDPLANATEPWQEGRGRRRLATSEVPDDRHFNANCAIVIENGVLDNHVGVAERQRFAEEMLRHGCHNVQFHDHYNAEHGFALAPGVISTRYEELSDRRSTLSMFGLFLELWGRYGYVPSIGVDVVNACGTDIGKYWGGSCCGGGSKL